MLQHNSLKEKKMFVKMYRKNYAKMKDEHKAMMKTQADMKNGCRIAKSSGISKIYEIKAKSSLSDNKSYFAEIIFGSTSTDDQGDTVSYDKLLCNLRGMKADIEHANLFNNPQFDHDYLFEVVDSFFNGKHNIGLVKFNPEHGQFKQVWDNIGKFGASFEYDADTYAIMGLSGTFTPSNPDAKVINAFEKVN